MHPITIERPWLAEYQKGFLYNPHRFTVTEAATKVGKTLSHSWWLFEQAHHPVDLGDEYLWLAPTYAQAEMVFNDVVRKVAETGAYKVNRSSLTIETPAGGILRYKTAEIPDNLYGPSNIRAIVGDEFTRWRPLVWPVVRSLATARRCPVKLIGNYIGESNWGHRLAIENASDPEWAYFRIDAYKAVEAGIMRAEEVDSARRSLPPAMFAALFLCQGSAHPLQMMDAGAIADIWTNEAERGSRYMTVDPAGDGQDLAVVMVFDGMHIEEIYTEERSNGPDFTRKVDAIAKKWEVGRSKMAVDADGLGGMGVADHFKGCVRFHGGAPIVTPKMDKRLNFANLRTQCYYLLADTVNDSGLSVNPEFDYLSADIGSELEWVRRKDDITAGKLGIISKKEVKEGIGRSPGYSDCMMMRMVFELRPEAVGNSYLRAKGRRYHKEDVSQAIKQHFSKYKRPQ